MVKISLILIFAILIVLSMSFVGAAYDCVDSDNSYEYDENYNRIDNNLQESKFTTGTATKLDKETGEAVSILGDSCLANIILAEAICNKLGLNLIPDTTMIFCPPESLGCKNLRGVLTDIEPGYYAQARCEKPWENECIPELYGEDCEIKSNRADRRRECQVGTDLPCETREFVFPINGIEGESEDGSCKLILKPQAENQVMQEDLRIYTQFRSFQMPVQGWNRELPIPRKKYKYCEETLLFEFLFKDYPGWEIEIKSGYEIKCSDQTKRGEAISQAAVKFIKEGTNARGKEYLSERPPLKDIGPYIPYTNIMFEIEAYSDVIPSRDCLYKDGQLGCERLNLNFRFGSCGCKAVEDRDRDYLAGLIDGTNSWEWADCTPLVQSRKDPDDNRFNSIINPYADDDTFETNTQSTYFTREIANFDEQGTAYQFLPSGLQFNVPVQITLLHNGQRFSSGSGIGMYRYEDDLIEVMCTLDEKSSTSNTISTNGGTINLQDATLTIPANALSQNTELTIRKVELICDYRFENMIPQIKKWKNGEISESTVNEIVNRWISTVVF